MANKQFRIEHGLVVNSGSIYLGGLDPTGIAYSNVSPTNIFFSPFAGITYLNSRVIVGEGTSGPGTGFIGGSVQIPKSYSLGWLDRDDWASATNDLVVVRDAANVLAQRNGTGLVPQTFRIYNTYTDAGNLERLNLAWSSNTFNITSSAIGTGVIRPISITMNDVPTMVFTAAGDVGIGRSDPGYKVDIVGTINASAVLVNGLPISGGGGGNGVPGGATTTVQYNDGASTFGGNTRFTFDKSTAAITLGGANLTSVSAPALNVTQTWANGAVSFSALRVSVNAIASAAYSKLIQLGTIISGDIFSVGIDDVGGNHQIGFGGVIQSLNGYGYSFVPGALGGHTIDLVNGGVFVSSDWNFQWYPGTNRFAGGADLILSRQGAGELRFGGPDAAAAVRQNLSVQSVLTGTANANGVDWILKASAGTGPLGGSGNIIFQIAPSNIFSSTAFTSQNPFYDAFAIRAETLSLGQTSLRFDFGVSNYTGVSTEPVSVASYYHVQDGAWTLKAQYNAFTFNRQGDSLEVGNYPLRGAFTISTGVFGWHQTGAFTDGTYDTYISKDAPGIVVIGVPSLTTNNSLRIYNKYTDSANVERLGLNWQANVINISSEAIGTGVLRPMNFNMNNSIIITIANTGSVGIGRTNPGVALDVVGTVNASNMLINGAGIPRLAFLTVNTPANNLTATSNSDTLKIVGGGSIIITGNTANQTLMITDGAPAAFARANSSAQLAYSNIGANGTFIVAGSNTALITLVASNVSIVGNTQSSNITFDLRDTGITGGPYGGDGANAASFTVDSKGRLTAGANTPTIFLRSHTSDTNAINTAAQSQNWFPTTGNLTVANATTYMVEAELVLVDTLTTHTQSIQLTGTATFDWFLINIEHRDQANNVIVTPQPFANSNMRWEGTDASTARVLNPTNIIGQHHTVLKGMIVVKAGGTICPRFQVSAVGAPIAGYNFIKLKQGTYFALYPVAANTANAIGPWSA